MPKHIIKPPHTNQTNQPPSITMDSIKQAANYVSESVQGAVSGASKEGNKQIAKDSQAPVGTRLTAAKDAASDKISETGHDNKADAHKNLI
ncbi:Glucose-repressible protein [Paramyrothecium foliicola]|nr:Glucose-repressible protein [Paramyrothecium foliicola]